MADNQTIMYIGGAIALAVVLYLFVFSSNSNNAKANAENAIANANAANNAANLANAAAANAANAANTANMAADSAEAEAEEAVAAANAVEGMTNSKANIARMHLARRSRDNRTGGRPSGKGKPKGKPKGKSAGQPTAIPGVFINNNLVDEHLARLHGRGILSGMPRVSYEELMARRINDANKKLVERDQNKFILYEGRNFSGNNTIAFPDRTVSYLAAYCNPDPNCKGFTSDGNIKSAIKPIDKWVQDSSFNEPGEGLYVKRYL